MILKKSVCSFTTSKINAHPPECGWSAALVSGVGKAKESEGANSKLFGQGELGYLEHSESECGQLFWWIMFGPFYSEDLE